MAEALRYPPLPPGTPHLMPFEEFPFNGDTFLEVEVLRLKEKHGLRDAIETGTCLGSTTCWLAENFSHVVSIEVNATYAAIARKRLSAMPEVHNRINFSILKGSSADLLPQVLDDEPVFIFLDAHWEQQCPLLDELKAIANAGIRPCIVIHDFQVPGTDFGFDAWNDQPFTLEWVTPYMDRIYGEGRWVHNYPTEVAGARRGWISIEPCR